jgi:hypothetical protein
MLGNLEILFFGHKIKVRNIQKAEGDRFIEIVRNRIAKSHRKPLEVKQTLNIASSPTRISKKQFVSSSKNIGSYQQLDIKKQLEIKELVKNQSEVENIKVDNPKITEKPDPFEKIRSCKELLDIGAITTEEFQQIKDKYLNQI